MRSDDIVEDLFVPKRRCYNGYHEFMKSQKSQGVNDFVNVKPHTFLVLIKYLAVEDFGCERVILYQT